MLPTVQSKEDKSLTLSRSWVSYHMRGLNIPLLGQQRDSPRETRHTVYEVCIFNAAAMIPIPVSAGIP